MLPGCVASTTPARGWATLHAMRIQIHPIRALGLLAALTVVVVAASSALLAWEMRKRDLERERLDSASVAHMLREETERHFDAADRVLRGVQERMETSVGAAAPLDGNVVRLLLGSRVFGAPNVDVLAIADATGRVVNASRDDPHLARSIDQSAYYRAFVQGGAEGLYVDRPVRSGPGEWTMDMARAFRDTGGRLRGIVVLTMRPPRLEDFQQRMDPDHSRPLAILLDDGTLVASLPPRDGFIGERPPDYAAAPLKGTQVRTLTRTAGDGTQQSFALARTGAFPLVVSVMSDDDTVLAAWRERAFSIALGALAVCAFTVTAAILLARELAREVRLAQQLRDANDRYHRTVESLMDAVVSVDATGTITLFNPAAERMFGIPAGEALGGPLDRLIPRRARLMHTRYMDRFVESPDAASGMQSNLDVTGLRVDGTEFPLETSLAHTMVDGRAEVTAVLRDVTQRRRAESELQESNRQLRALSTSLQEVREQERSRIAAELHDELGQQLTGLKLELSWLAARVKDGRGARVEEVDAMRHQLDATIASVRRIATDLRPRVLDDLGFCDAVAWQASEFARRSGIAVELDLAGFECVGEDAVATALFRIVQESLTNIARHSRATHVKVQVQLRPTDDAVVLRVRDDGLGFDATERTGQGIGLVIMRERATALGGDLRVHSKPGAGTTIEVTLPLAAASAVEQDEVVV